MGIRAFKGLRGVAAVVLLAGSTIGAMAQDGPLSPADAARKCQTVTTCNFSRHGDVRGCLSSYTCRNCRLVRTRCNLGAGHRFCQQFVCGWGA